MCARWIYRPIQNLIVPCYSYVCDNTAKREIDPRCRLVNTVQTYYNDYIFNTVLVPSYNRCRNILIIVKLITGNIQIRSTS